MDTSMRQFQESVTFEIGFWRSVQYVELHKHIDPHWFFLPIYSKVVYNATDIKQRGVETGSTSYIEGEFS